MKTAELNKPTPSLTRRWFSTLWDPLVSQFPESVTIPRYSESPVSSSISAEVISVNSYWFSSNQVGTLASVFAWLRLRFSLRHWLSCRVLTTPGTWRWSLVGVVWSVFVWLLFKHSFKEQIQLVIVLRTSGEFMRIRHFCWRRSTKALTRRSTPRWCILLFLDSVVWVYFRLFKCWSGEIYEKVGQKTDYRARNLQCLLRAGRQILEI